MNIEQEISESIKLLSEKRPIFHSEDDFKFSFSKIISETLGDSFNIRLERPEEIKMINRNNVEKNIRAPIDIVIINKNNNISYPIELKYKTKKLETYHDKEKYKLTNQGALPRGRFSFRKDIFRIEQLLIKKSNVKQGYFIVITNDDKYLQNISNKVELSKNFSFHDGMKLKKNDESWDYTKHLNKGYSLDKNNELINKNKQLYWTQKGDEFYRLNLENEYIIKWKLYSEIEKQKFNFSLTKIE